jgi:hypothetical protein
MKRVVLVFPFVTVPWLVALLITWQLALYERPGTTNQDTAVQRSSPGASAISGDTWFPIGPAPLNKGQAPCGVLNVNMGELFDGEPASGRASVIAVNAAEPDDVWLGTSGGGVWHSVTGGTNGSWKPVSDQEDSLAIGAIALADCDANGCDTVYVGTGENAIRRDTYYGAGLLVGSVASAFDVSWTAKGQSLFEFASINNVVLDPDTVAPDKRIYVTLSSGTTTSAVQATLTAPLPPMGYGIYKSEDNGDSWGKLDVPGSDGARPTDLEMHPQTSEVLFAGFMGRGIFRGVLQNDLSVDWCPLHPGIAVPQGCPDPAGSGLPDPGNVAFDHVELSIYPNNPSIMYAVFGHCPNPLFRRCKQTVYKSIDGGTTWSSMYQPPDPCELSCGYSYCCTDSYSRYTHGLAIDPSNPDTIVVSGLFLCKSDDSGQTFDEIGIADLHWDLHSAIYPDPNNTQRMYSTSDGGFAHSNDGGTNWTGGNEGLQTAGVQTLSTSPLEGADEVIVGTQDNALLMWVGGSAWDRKWFGDSGSTAMDLSSKSFMYDVYIHDSIRRSTNFGASWSSANSGLDGKFCSETINQSCDDQNPCPDGERCWAPTAFYPPLVQDPTPPHPLYFGTNRLFSSDDKAANWIKKSPILAGDQVFFPDIATTNVITAIAVAPSNNKRVYVGYYDGQIWRSKTTGQSPCDGQQCWEDASPGLSVMVTSLAVDPDNHETVYATFSGFNITEHVYRSTSSGDQWTAISGPDPGNPNDPASLPDIPANVIRVEPSTPNTLWLGTDRGVYKSTDAGQNWSRFSNGLPNVPVFDIAIDEDRGRVFAATHGRGVFLLTGPSVYTSEAWVDGEIWDVAVYAYGFTPDLPSCEMRLILQDGATCAQGTMDGDGNPMFINDEGKLATQDGIYVDKYAWACYAGTCVGNTDVAQCNDPQNPLTSVILECDSEVGIGQFLGCPNQANPPGTIFDFDGQASLPIPCPLDFTASVQVGDGSTRSLCTVRVSVNAGDASLDVLTRTRDAINASSTCAASGVAAQLRMPPPEDQDDTEDGIGPFASLVLDAPGVSGGQLVGSLKVGPGCSGTCFSLDDLGAPLQNSLLLMRLGFETGTAGASGGGLSITEASWNGFCQIDFATDPGDTALGIATDVARAFVSRDDADCPGAQNPRDVTQDRDSVITVLASGLQVCLDDAGVGFTLRPEELANVHPVADAGIDESVECTGPGGEGFTLDGSASSDPDSTLGSSDDIVSYEWFEDFGLPNETSLGSGPLLGVTLAVGSHTVTLQVTDSSSHIATDSVVKTVTDTVPPFLSLGVGPGLLWPPNHRMVDIAASATTDDLCSVPTVALASVASNEPDDAPGPDDGETANDIQEAATGTPDFTFRLRAERNRSGAGRTYTVTYTATDGAGNATTEVMDVDVPLEQDGTAEPLMLTVSQSRLGTVVSWTPVASALHYNVIQGSVGNILDPSTAYELGPVTCIEAASTDLDTVGNEHTTDPVLDEVFFYLVEFDDGFLASGYGTETATKPRVPGAGVCP